MPKSKAKSNPMVLHNCSACRRPMHISRCYARIDFAWATESGPMADVQAADSGEMLHPVFAICSQACMAAFMHTFGHKLKET